MKIRTDFVTNSSSSSFVVEVVLEDAAGKQRALRIPSDEQDPDGVESAGLNCTAAQLTAADGLQSLLALLEASLEVGDEDSDNEYMAEYVQDVKGGFHAFCQEALASESPIVKVTLKNSWHAWGEGCSCFCPMYLLTLSDEAVDLAKTICEKDGAEKEAAKEKLAGLLKQCPGFGVEGGWSASWPTGFLGVSPAPAIRYDLVAKDIEELARKMLTDRSYYDTDYAREVVEIDLASKEVRACAEYILGGCAENDPPYTPQSLVSLKDASKALVDAAAAIDPKYLTLSGTFYNKRYAHISALKPGDRIALRVQHDDPYYGLAIEAFDLQGNSLGYLTSGRISASQLAQIVDSVNASVAAIIPLEGRSDGNFKFTMSIKLSKK